MKKTIPAGGLLVASMLLSSPALADHHKTASRQDFKDWCNAFEGRWVGEVTWVADWPGLGRKGEKVTTYLEARRSEDDNALFMKFFGGDGSASLLYAYDSGAKKIKSMWVSSGGGVTTTVVYKKGDQWIEEGTGSLIDGREDIFTSMHNFTNDGQTLTITGSGEVDGEKTADQRDVWRRVSK